MATPQIDALMEAFAKFTADGDLDPEEGVRLFLVELFGPTKRVRVGEDDEGNMRVQVDEADPEPDLDMDEATAEGLRQVGLNPDLVRIAARSASFQDYVTRKARLDRGRR